MAHKVIDRCKETTSTTGTGTLTLTGAVANFVAMADATGGLTTDGDTSWFLAENGAEWELFLGTRVDATHLARTTVIKSSNGGAAVSFTAPPTVFSTVPAEKISAVGPSFSAYLGSAQTFTTAVTTKVAFNSEQFDNGGCFDSTTNRRFQPTVAGNYQVSWLVTFKSTGALSVNTYTPTLYKNGAVYANSNYANCASTVAALGGGALVYMNGTTDYLEVFATASGTGTLTFGGGTGETTFSAYLAALPGAPMLAPIVAPGPSFSAGKNATQSISATTFTKVTFPLEAFDNGNCFDAATNHRFQPNVEGYYQVSSRVGVTAVFSTNSLVAIYKNGANYAAGAQPNSQGFGLNVSALIYLNGTTDYIEIYVYLSGALTLAGNAQENYFTAFLAALPQVPQPTSGPAFSAYRSGNQTGLTNTTYVKAQLNAEEFDTGDCFDSTTNYRFTPNVAGYYNFQWSIDCRGTTLTVGHAQLYKNGVAHKAGIWAASSSSVAVSAGSATVYMNGSTDYVELFGYTAAASGNLFNSGAAATYLSGHFVRGA